MQNISKSKIDDFKANFQGEVVLPGDKDYHEVRRIWNAMIDRKPAIIARCLTSDGILQALTFAREHHLLIAIRGGGHNIAGNAVCDDGVMIDLSLMKNIQIDPNTRIALVDPGCTLGELDAATQEYGLAVPLGINSTTGVAGLTLGGGFGWISRKYGMTIDNLLSADVVTADGRKLRACSNENEDLFWGLRGGGGNFGIVSKFEFRLHPLGPDILSGLIVFPFDQARQVLTKYAHFTETTPDELNVWIVIRKAPPLPFLPADVHGRDVVVFALCYTGDPEDGKKYLDSIRKFGLSYGEYVAVQPYKKWQQTFDPLLTAGARNYWKSHNFKELGSDAIDTVIEFAGNLPSPLCEIFVGETGGQSSRIPITATAFSGRDSNYVLNVHCRWMSASDDSRCIAWAREFFEKSKPFASDGVYVNFLTEDERDRLSFAYGPNYQHLREVKQKYDPQNIFRMNQNIKPW